MSAAVAKGIILSISIIAALGVAVAESPQVQLWLEEQRRKIAELLRQIGEELDPQSRRAAEAFAYEGRTVANDESLQREASGSQEAAEVATGRSLSSASTIRRIPIKGPIDPIEAEERRRKGREYLAQRNQQMEQLRQKRHSAPSSDLVITPPSPTFDELVDAEGRLKANDTVGADLPSPPLTASLPSPVQVEMEKVEQHLAQAISVHGSGDASSSGPEYGSVFGNPFSDEFAVDRSITPKPPVPPKISLSRPATPPLAVPGSFEVTPQPQAQAAIVPDELTYEEQLAIALSLSEQENSASSATVLQRQNEQDDHNLKVAIAASLKDMHHQQAENVIHQPQMRTAAHMAPWVDHAPAEPVALRPYQSTWTSLLDTQLTHSNDASNASPFAPRSEISDELYRLTPELTRARLASLDAQHLPARGTSQATSNGTSLPFDPVREAARNGQPASNEMEGSFHSALSSRRRRSVTLDHETPLLIDINDDVLPEGARTPTSRAQSSFGFQTDSDADTSASQSETSIVDVMELDEDSDVDMLSEEGDGIATPDSWSEVGSRDADSELGDSPSHEHSQLGY